MGVDRRFRGAILRESVERFGQLSGFAKELPDEFLLFVEKLGRVAGFGAGAGVFDGDGNDQGSQFLIRVRSS